jgi:regulatory protein
MSSFTVKKVQESSQQGAFLYALRLLAKQDYSCSKLKSKLKLKGFSPEHIQEALDELLEKQYLCDDRYSHAKIKQLAHRGFAPRTIVQLLSQESISITEADVYEVFDVEGVDIEEQIVRLLEKKRPETSWLGNSLDARKLQDKAIRFALTKGHSYGEIRKQLSVILHHLEQH